jgi:hypothetical protein
MKVTILDERQKMGGKIERRGGVRIRLVDLEPQQPQR